MNTTTTIDLVICVLGALAYGFLPGKGSQAGLVAFGCGLLAALLSMGTHPVRF